MWLTKSYLALKCVVYYQLKISMVFIAVLVLVNGRGLEGVFHFHQGGGCRIINDSYGQLHQHLLIGSWKTIVEYIVIVTSNCSQ